MKVAVGTTNKAKGKAAYKVLHAHWPSATIEIVPTESRVSAMPLSSDETLKGALNRAHAAIKNVAGADYGVGLEGGVHTTEYGTLLIGWAAIVSRDGRESVGGSPSIVLPEAIAKELKKGAELGPLMDKLYGTKGKIISHEKGTYGLLTQDRITRTEQFALALECAIAPFVNTKLYKK